VQGVVAAFVWGQAREEDVDERAAVLRVRLSVGVAGDEGLDLALVLEVGDQQSPVRGPRRGLGRLLRQARRSSQYQE